MSNEPRHFWIGHTRSCELQAKRDNFWERPRVINSKHDAMMLRGIVAPEIILHFVEGWQNMPRVQEVSRTLCEAVWSSPIRFRKIHHIEMGKEIELP